MEPAVIMFFISVIIMTAMVCFTIFAVTKKIVDYKTMQLEMGPSLIPAAPPYDDETLAGREQAALAAAAASAAEAEPTQPQMEKA